MTLLFLFFLPCVLGGLVGDMQKLTFREAWQENATYDLTLRSSVLLEDGIHGDWGAMWYDKKTSYRFTLDQGSPFLIAYDIHPFVGMTLEYRISGRRDEWDLVVDALVVADGDQALRVETTGDLEVEMQIHGMARQLLATELRDGEENDGENDEALEHITVKAAIVMIVFVSAALIVTVAGFIYVWRITPR